MKDTNTAAGYAFIYHGLAEVARKHGYALALHGSMLTDLDVIAVPWTDEACEPEKLITALSKHCGMCWVNLDGKGNQSMEPAQKPHGRLAWKLFPDTAGSVDVSVLPRSQ